MRGPMDVLNCIPDPRIGGPHRRALDVGESLREHGVETTFLVPEPGEEFAKAVDDAGLRSVTEEIPRIRDPKNVAANVGFLAGTIPAALRVRDVIENRQIDVAHVNGPLNLTTALGARWSDASLVWHFNDTLTPTPLRQFAGRVAMRWADEIVVAADAVHPHFFPETTDSHTIYAPVDLDRFDPDSVRNSGSLRREFGIASDVAIVGTIGNFNPVKGHSHLLRAVERLVESYSEVKVLLVGARLESRQGYYERLRSQTRDLSLEDVVEFVGFREDVPEILDELDLFVLPSISEACPITVLEAMAMRCPVVATSVGGVPELVTDPETGWLVPPGGPVELADAMREALESPEERARRATRGRERVEKLFSLEACTTAHLNVYREALD